MVPLSIVIAAIVIAGALFMVNKGESPDVADSSDTPKKIRMSLPA